MRSCTVDRAAGDDEEEPRLVALADDRLARLELHRPDHALEDAELVAIETAEDVELAEREFGEVATRLRRRDQLALAKLERLVAMLEDARIAALSGDERMERGEPAIGLEMGEDQRLAARGQVVVELDEQPPRGRYRRRGRGGGRR